MMERMKEQEQEAMPMEDDDEEEDEDSSEYETDSEDEGPGGRQMLKPVFVRKVRPHRRPLRPASECTCLHVRSHICILASSIHVNMNPCKNSLLVGNRARRIDPN